MRDFPEQLRRERAAASAEAEELHSRAAMSIVAQKCSDFEHRLQQERQQSATAESELNTVRDRCSILESQLKISGDSVLALQSQLSKSESAWRCEFDAIQQLLQEHASQAETLNKQLQAQSARADEATVKWREAEADTRQCRQSMQLDADRCKTLEDKIQSLSQEYEANLEEIMVQVDHQMNVQDGFLSYIQALAAPDPSDSQPSYLGSSMAACSDRELFDMDEALGRLLKCENELQPLSATARMIWLRLSSDSPSPGAAPLRLCVNWLMHHDAAAAFGLPVFQRPVVDLALAALNIDLNFQDFLMLVVRCVEASHSLSRFLSVSGPSLVISRAQFKQNMRLFGLKPQSSASDCDAVLDTIDVDRSGSISFCQYQEWYESQKNSDSDGEFLKL